MSDEAIQHVKLSYAEARQITEEIRNASESVWTLLKKAHDGQAWSALGFPTWQEYVKQEFQMSRVRAHQLMNFGEVQKALEPVLTNVNVTEGQIRSLTKLDTPEQQQEAWTEAVQTSGGKPTAEHVEAAVERVKARTETPVIEVGMEETQEPRQEPVIYSPADGLQYADMAIVSLSKIHRNDTQRKAAKTKIINWAESNL